MTMNAQRIAGLTAAISGAAILVLAVVSAVAGPAFTFGQAAPTWVTPAQDQPAGPFGRGMMGGFGMGPGMMGGFGIGPGMMGGGMGPGMMGPDHMGPSGYGTQGTPAPIPGAPTVTVTASDLRFAPTEITLPSREVNLTLRNEGQVIHDVTIPGLSVRIVARLGETRTVGLRDLPKGRYAGYCSVPGHAEAGMRIAVVVD